MDGQEEAQGWHCRTIECLTLFRRTFRWRREGHVGELVGTRHVDATGTVGMLVVHFRRCAASKSMR